MTFETQDGRFFSLEVERYEFPDEELGPTEDNPADEFDTGRFLVVVASFRNSTGAWEATAPLLTTTELERFAAWLESIAAGNPRSAGAYFTERDLEFSFDETTRQLLVHASGDLLPNWSERAACLTIGFPVDEIDLRSEVNSLRTQLQAFPGRPPIQTPT